MKFIDSFDGNKLRYLLEGEGETCLVFIPGLTCPLETWEYQRSFSSKFKTLFVELAGHGKSGSDREIWSLESYAKDVQAIVESLDLSNLILIGHSTGGPIMLETTKLMPDRIIGLIGVDTLFNIPLYTYADPDKIDEFMEAFNISEQTWKDYLFLVITNRVNHDIVSTDFVVEFMDLITYPHFEKFFTDSIRELYKWDFNDFLEDLNVPIRCVMAGETVPEEARADYTANFPAVFMEGLNHFLFLEKPDEFNSLLENAINEILNTSS
jgi:pimeloyl-ACP methyl ester carboxylesterase